MHPYIHCTRSYPDTPMSRPMKFFSSDLFRHFGIGFGFGAVALLLIRFDGVEGLALGLF